MISNRRINGVKELAIFDNFFIDANLPKYADTKINGGHFGNSVTFGTNTSGSFSMDDMNITIGVPSEGDSDPTIARVWVGDDGNTHYGFTWRQKIYAWLVKKLRDKNFKEKKPNFKYISITEFFTGLCKSFEELTPVADIANHYGKAILQAKVLGQSALVQKFTDLIDVVRGEAQLVASGMKTYVSEKQVIAFYEKVGSDKNLKLTWIKNFNRVIPEAVYLAKKQVDERRIFDNYVILHYDPQNNGELLTKEEIAAKKDPILFGLIQNSRKLYYIADWKDEYCDLTLEDMFKELGEKTLKINNKSVKTFIDKTQA